MKKYVVQLYAVLYLFVMVLSFAGLRELFIGSPIIELIAYFLLANIWLVIWFRLLSINQVNKSWVLVIYVWLGSVYIFIFAIWLINYMLGLLNPLFLIWGMSFQIGYIFTGLAHYLCGFPMLLVGVAFVALAIHFEGLAKYRLAYFLLVGRLIRRKDKLV